jgi:glutaredoxin
MTSFQPPFTFLVACCFCGHALAQTTIYRIENPNGGVMFSDRLPTNPEQGKVVSTGTGAQSVAASANLPFELKQVVAKYPVTLYTAKECSPCDSARALLTTRGVPFSERTISTAEDSEQLKRLSGESSLPFLTIGAQRVKGFSPTEWAQYLDAAGYPASSMLPAGFKNSAPTPLAPVPAAVVAAKPAAKEPATAPVAPNANNNPAGIVF